MTQVHDPTFMSLRSLLADTGICVDDFVVAGLMGKKKLSEYYLLQAVCSCYRHQRQEQSYSYA